ncbi:alpha/beta fold hydrolase [Crossiella cryophila]|uniref:Pimeloyl-ACP methyl ester carboxylesterase n=1 Tax=Crossiella cryophila TaxID=43355 RepID=A0A7W7CFA9_9PSEU|nr:alpha/beta fold hydrolase [Crossiella cryophila]MBB4678708.1 pimeloyl-ACP methyl ester carboxylesterase [Crossiella cryophila]
MAELLRRTLAHRVGAALDVRWGRRLARRAVPRPPGVRLARLATATVRHLDTDPRGERAVPLVVLLADPPVTVESYVDVVELLRPSHRVVVAELPGFGFSAPLRGYDFRFHPVNDVLAEFLTGLGGSHTTLVAPCGAAYCGLDLAGRRPGLIDRLVLSQAPGWAAELAWRDARNRVTKGMLRRPVLGQLLLRAVQADRGGEWLRQVCATPEVRERLLADFAAASTAGALFSLASVFQQYLAGPAPLVDPGGTEVIALWGAADPSHARTDPDSIKTLAPAATVLRLPGVGHFPELERPEALSRVL